MKCYAVIDTNVLVSALLTAHDDAATVQVISRMLSGEIIPVYSQQILDEYWEVLHRKKFHFAPERIRYLLAAIEKFGIYVTPTETGMILPDPKDLPFYEVVMERRNDDAYLVTGNTRHFPAEEFIVTPRQMLDILNNTL